MAWIDTKLFAGEEIILRNRSPMSIFAPSAVFFAIGLVNFVFLLVAFITLLISSLRYFYREFIVTNKRVIIKKGFFYKRHSDISMDDIGDVIVNQSFAEKLFKSGRVTIFGASIPTFKFKDVSRPLDFRNAICSQLPVKAAPYFDET